MTHGTDYVIERLENNAWVSCEKTDELHSAEIVYELEPERLCNRSYDLTDVLRYLNPAHIASKRIAVCVDSEENSQCSLWAKFIVVENESVS